VVIRPGATGGNLSVRTATVTASTTVTVTATYNGASKTAGVTVTPVTLTAIAVTPSSLTGGLRALLSVTLSGPAPSGGASVGLSSGNAAFPVPASVVIPAGKRSAALEVRTTTVNASTSVTVTATYNNTTKTAGVTVTPPLK
jgi:hypothetical protein